MTVPVTPDDRGALVNPIQCSDSSMTMEQKSDISVIVPTHDDGELVERSLASIAAQSLPPDEVIVIDDGSSSSASLAALDRAIRRFPQTRLIRQSNAGPSAARNRGVAEATAAFIAFVDADDELERDNLQTKKALFDGSSDTVATFAGIRFVEPDGRIHYSRLPRYRGTLDPDLVGRPDGIPGFLWAYMFRREAFEAIGGLDENLRIMEDFDALIRLGRLGGKFAGCNDPLYTQHRRLGSLARASAGRQLRGALRFLGKARENRYFSAGELRRRYLMAPYAALKVIVRYSLRR